MPGFLQYTCAHKDVPPSSLAAPQPTLCTQCEAEGSGAQRLKTPSYHTCTFTDKKMKGAGKQTTDKQKTYSDDKKKVMKSYNNEYIVLRER